jgi:hypothetical protein
MDREIAQALEAARAAHFDARGEACDYAALESSAERARLTECLAGLATFDVKRAALPAQTAFWINLFNSAVLRDAAELRSAARHQDVQAFFERPRLEIGGHRYSLDDVEHGVLRGNMPKQGRRHPPMARGDPRLESMPLVFDERVHFALHSACRSSPALGVFEGGRLDRQLEDAAVAYVRRTSRVEGAGAVLVVSRIFRWFAADFGSDSDIIEFVTARLEDEAAVEAIDRRLGAVKLAYAEFDWTLNRR